MEELPRSLAREGSTGITNSDSPRRPPRYDATNNDRHRTSTTFGTSSDGTQERLGVERQVPPCRELARRKGWAVIEPAYEDHDLTAFSGKRRPGYEQLLADAKAGRINIIVAWHADRLTRQPTGNEALIELAERYGIRLATVTGEHDLATPSGRLHFRMLGSIARYESEHRAERLRLTKAKVSKWTVQAVM